MLPLRRVQVQSPVGKFLVLHGVAKKMTEHSHQGQLGWALWQTVLPRPLDWGAVTVNHENMFSMRCICLPVGKGGMSSCLCHFLVDGLWYTAHSGLMLSQQQNCFLSCLPLWGGFLDQEEVILLFAPPPPPSLPTQLLPRPCWLTSVCILQSAERAPDSGPYISSSIGSAQFLPIDFWWLGFLPLTWSLPREHSPVLSFFLITLSTICSLTHFCCRKWISVSSGLDLCCSWLYLPHWRCLTFIFVR